MLRSPPTMTESALRMCRRGCWDLVVLDCWRSIHISAHLLVMELVPDLFKQLLCQPSVFIVLSNGHVTRELRE